MLCDLGHLFQQIYDGLLLDRVFPKGCRETPR
jgi:hypothetical protein